MTKHVESGARCNRCGHYEQSAAKAVRDLAHCPSCSRHTRWVHPDTSAVLLFDGERVVVEADYYEQLRAKQRAAAQWPGDWKGSATGAEPGGSSDGE